MAGKGIVLTEEQKRRRRSRNIAIALTLFGLVVLFYIMTIFHMGGSVANRPI
jgi:hypothetical protein